MHPFSYRRYYRGPLQAVIFDWAGTTVDHGCLAPALVFVEVFRDRGVEITMAQAREPMGLHKQDHIRAIMGMPAVAAAWRVAHGSLPDESDIGVLYSEFIPRQVEIIGRYAEPIDGVSELAAALRARGIQIGSNTGYNQEMMNVLAPAAEAAGYAPDCIVCSSDVPQGRPAPWMAMQCARLLNVYPPSAVVKVDDTVPGIAEGLNAGMWTVAVSETGNEVGLSQTDLHSLDSSQRHALRSAAEQRLAAAGAHYVIDSVSQLLPCLEDIQRRLDRGESP